MRIFNLTFEATKTCQNGNERRTRTNVLVHVSPYEDWDSTMKKATDYLENVKHYYRLEYVSAKPAEVVE